MGEFSIEKLTQTVKKKPILVIGGVVLAIGAGVIMAARSGSNGVSLATAPYEPVTDPAADAGGIGSAVDPAIMELLSKMSDQNAATGENFNYLNNTLSELMSQNAQNYQGQYNQTLPEYMDTPSSLLADTGNVDGEISLIMSTPSFTTVDRDYSLSQVHAISDWAANEQESINSGSSGTTKNPVGLGTSNLIMEMHDTGYVSFRPKGSAPTPSPKAAAPGPAGDAYRAANDSVKLASNQKAVSKVTGKTGNVEQQMSGMSQSQKINTLKKAGLY